MYQSDWQKRLFSHYGNELVRLDPASYRSTWYNLPLFFFVVKTNIYNQIAAIFATKDENDIPFFKRENAICKIYSMQQNFR